MIVVLEGCDGAGKSTLAHTLCNRHGWEYRHEGTPPVDTDLLDYYGGLVEEARWQIYRGEVKGVVFDRLALGERVYGEVYRNNDRLGSEGWWLMKRVLYAADVLHVVCAPPFEVCLASWKRRQKTEMLADERQLRAVYDRYMELVGLDARFHVKFDYTRGPDELTALETLVSWPMEGLLPGVIGHPKASYLFVGEIGAKPEARTADLAFFGMENSSGYLNKALDDAGYSDYEMAFTNADRHDGQKIQWPDTRRVIALGKRAEQECGARGLKHFALPHPQYWKRFHASERERYVQMLREVRLQ